MRKGTHHSEESRARMRLAQGGKILTPEHRQRISESNLGKPKGPMSDQHRRNLSRVLKGRVLSEEWRRHIGDGSRGHLTSKETREKISAANLGKKRSEDSKKNMRGANSGQWNGGIHHHCGYVQIMSPDHPFCQKNRYVYEHRLVIEKMIGRFMKKTESVHHINENRGDNSPDNLMAFISERAHQRFHRGTPCRPGDIVYDGRTLKH